MPQQTPPETKPPACVFTHVPELVDAAREAGFTQVKTAIGWIDLAEWTPYGYLMNLPTHRGMLGMALVGDRFEEFPGDAMSSGGFVRGSWPLR